MSAKTSDRFERHIDIREGGRKAVDWLAENSPLSRSQLKQVMQAGAVWLTRGKTRRIRRAGNILKYGDQLHLYYDPEILAQEPPKPWLIADEGSYSVWCKPFGMCCQGSKYGDHCSLYRWVELELERDTYTVHRLDRATEGVIVLGHDKATTAALAAQFERREVEKRYRAVVQGVLQLQDALLDTPLGGKSARTRVTTLEVDVEGQRSLVEVSLETGRKHQIRQHLADLGHPILGDRLYGRGSDDGVDLQLQSCLLRFCCPLSGDLRTYRIPEAQLLVLAR